MLKKYSWQFSIGIIAICLASYCFLVFTGKIPRAEVCSKGEYGPPDQCADYDIIFAYIGRVFVFADDHNGIITALAGTAVAIFTGTLWSTSKRQGELTQKALEISDRALTIAQWPLFYIEEQRFITPASRPSAVSPQFEYRAVFHGDAPAFVRPVHGELIFEKSLPSKPPVKRTWRIVHGIQKKGFGLPDAIYWGGNEILSTPTAWAKARAEGKWFYAIGCIVYDDLFGNQHEFGFCYRGAIGGGWGMRAGGEAYNYHRLRSNEERTEMDSLGPPKPNEPPENSSGLSG